MIISEQHRFMFFEVGKTGTTSIANILLQHGEPETRNASPVLGYSDAERAVYAKHIPPVRVQDRLGQERFLNYFRFAFVRNPYDRLVSRFFFSGLAKSRFGSEAAAGPMTLEDVKLLCRYPRLGVVLRKEGPSDKYTQFRSLTWLDRFTQAGFLSDREGNLLVDFVGRYENIQEDFDNACDQIGLPRVSLPWLNRTRHAHYISYYTDETRDFVTNFYQDDLDRFGYLFDAS